MSQEAALGEGALWGSQAVGKGPLRMDGQAAHPQDVKGAGSKGTLREENRCLGRSCGWRM